MFVRRVSIKVFSKWTKFRNTFTVLKSLLKICERFLKFEVVRVLRYRRKDQIKEEV